MKRLIKKALLALAAVTLAGTIVAPRNAIAMPGPGGPACNQCGATKSCLCSSLESQYHCGSTKYEHGVIYTLGCKTDGVTCTPMWMQAPTPTQVHVAENVVENKTTAQHLEEQKVVETNNATPVANLHTEGYDAQMIAYYYYIYADQLASYNTTMDDANAQQLIAFLDAYAKQLAPYEAIMNKANAQ